ncbi:hypothetical protein H0H81_008426 [Sphagnurus paluster]|uniref:Amidase domain-containing protein n=1 Tax=Sphagnurus paluster TaxID=117069 RepID=A0A9P7FWW8_9AGAR|nr:hypothetical protein H0H81_008426 [Sphagnurus paluster]
MPNQNWQELAEDKKARQEASIPKQWLLANLPAEEQLNVTTFPETSGLLSSREIEITNAEVDALLLKLSTAEWSAVEVVTAFGKRAIIAHQLTNCLTEIFIERGLTRAAELDEYLKKTGKVIGPLHGLPVSLKDQIRLKGIESTMGYASWVGNYAERNSVLVDALEALGAVLYVKTNVPQTLMVSFVPSAFVRHRAGVLHILIGCMFHFQWPETFNLVFGRTVNPHNRSLTSGGSSGGEGALVGMYLSA